MIHAYPLTFIILEVVHSKLITVQCDFFWNTNWVFCSDFIEIECFMKQLTCRGDSYFNKTRSLKKLCCSLWHQCYKWSHWHDKTWHLCSNTVMVQKVTLTCQHVTSSLFTHTYHIHTHTYGSLQIVTLTWLHVTLCSQIVTLPSQHVTSLFMHTDTDVCCHILLHSTFKPNRCNFMHLQKLGIFNLKPVQVILKMKLYLVDARLLYHWTEWCGLEHWKERIITAISTSVPYILKLLGAEN
jgi:hypothetical protein